MIETKHDLKTFCSENTKGELILHIVPADDSVHVCATKPCVIFIRNLYTSKTYYFSFCHPDSVPSIRKEEFWDALWALSLRSWALDKKAFNQYADVSSVLDGNLAGYLTDNTLLDVSDYDTVAHQIIRRYANGHRQLNQVIPLFKLKESFDDMADDLEAIVKKVDIDFPFISFNSLILNTLGRIEEQGIFVNREKFKAHFDVEVGEDGIVYSRYNVYTATGRPSNSFGGINYAALKKDDGSRSCFCSRFGKDGRIVVIDYTAFHPRIISTLTNHPIPLDVEVYEYLAKLYFQKKVVDETDVTNAKQLTFRQLYGGVEEKYAHIKYLANLKTFIDEKWEFFQKHGYVETPIFHRRITEHHIKDPNPTKLFNYLLQAVEGEIAIPKIKEVLDYLLIKKSKAVLYTYDAMIFDFHKADGIETLKEIRKIMSGNGMYPMKTYVGETYQDVVLVDF